MDAIDRRIVTALQRDGRMKLAQLSEEVGLSPTPCARRVSMLEEAGFDSTRVLFGGIASVETPRFIEYVTG